MSWALEESVHGELAIGQAEVLNLTHCNKINFSGEDILCVLRNKLQENFTIFSFPIVTRETPLTLLMPVSIARDDDFTVAICEFMESDFMSLEKIRI